MKSKLFYVMIVLAAAALIVFSLSVDQRSKAIVAVVESQKTAISYHKPVQIRKIYVSAGQQVSKGDLLLEVERPDLIMDRTKLANERDLEESKKDRLFSDYQSKVRLLDIEIEGKIQRIESDIQKLSTEMEASRQRYAEIMSLAGEGDSNALPPDEEANKIKMNSYEVEKSNLQKYLQSEKNRLKILLDEDLKSLELKLDLISKGEEALVDEEATLKQFAPFDGTIGNVNAQLQELIAPYETIVSVYEKLPRNIKAYLNLDSNTKLSVGQTVSVESASRNYTSSGIVLEIGARIVEYNDPAMPQNPVPLFGKEVFIKLPADNGFLYGEQVYVYLPENEE